MASTTTAAAVNAVRTVLSRRSTDAVVVSRSSSTAAAQAVAAAAASASARLVVDVVDPVVQCRWWNGSADGVLDPASFVVDGGGKIREDDLHSGSLVALEMREKFDRVGLLHVQNTGLTDMDQQRRLASLVMGEQTDYEGGANPRDRLSDLGNVYDVGAPLEAHLHYHHEMTYKSHSVESIGFLCKHAVARPGVGWSFVSDSVRAHDAIMRTPLGPKLKDLGLCFIRRLTDSDAYTEGNSGAVYNHWQKSWLTDDPEEAVKVAQRQGLRVRWVPDPNVPGASMMETRYYKSAFEYVPVLDRNVLITSIADDGEWFDSWPALREVPQALRPMDMQFGDDTPISFEEKQLWTDCYDDFGIPIRWSAGDVAVVCNMRFAHGRPGIELLEGEKRELGVMLGGLFERQETRPDKW